MRQAQGGDTSCVENVIWLLDATAQAELVRSGAVSAVELVQAALDRADKLAELNAVSALFGERALARAAEASIAGAARDAVGGRGERTHVGRQARCVDRSDRSGDVRPRLVLLERLDEHFEVRFGHAPKTTEGALRGSTDRRRRCPRADT